MHFTEHVEPHEIYELFAPHISCMVKPDRPSQKHRRYRLLRTNWQSLRTINGRSDVGSDCNLVVKYILYHRSKAIVQLQEGWCSKYCRHHNSLHKQPPPLAPRIGAIQDSKDYKPSSSIDMLLVCPDYLQECKKFGEADVGQC